MTTDHPDHPERIKLESGLARLGLDVSPGALDGLLTYMVQLKEWSGTYNLVAPRERDFLLARHILDSLSIAPWLQAGSLLDVGTGAGLPGLPLAIIKPEMEVTLLDSAGKKIRFIRHVGRTLKLANIQPLQQRVEEFSENRVFANITSRAFASLKDFAKAVRPCADETTRLLAMKGAYPGQELEELPGWINVQSIEKLTVPYLHAERHLVMMSISLN
ncbi:MAG: 16S rRNA (guanine(527)-N(7))-methyltransferase RsmG [Gammaproteobacteria bacterium]|nr:16S rRNA (guanine(527)-N(7))-methyltransferase RsmG [Gammaproteobacteria bacterium]